MKLVPQDQGKIVAEYDHVWVKTKKGIKTRDHWYVMFPDGTVKEFSTKKQVEKSAKKYFKDNLEDGKVGIGRIEWRT